MSRSLLQAEHLLSELFLELPITTNGVTPYWLSRVSTLKKLIDQSTSEYGEPFTKFVLIEAAKLRSSGKGAWTMINGLAAMHQNLVEIYETMHNIQDRLFKIEFHPALFQPGMILHRTRPQIM